MLGSQEQSTQQNRKGSTIFLDEVSTKNMFLRTFSADVRHDAGHKKAGERWRQKGDTWATSSPSVHPGQLHPQSPCVQAPWQLLTNQWRKFSTDSITTNHRQASQKHINLLHKCETWAISHFLPLCWGDTEVERVISGQIPQPTSFSSQAGPCLVISGQLSINVPWIKGGVSNCATISPFVRSRRGLHLCALHIKRRSSYPTKFC